MHWFVASVAVNPKKPTRPRTWGYYRELANAIKCVKEGVSFHSERGYYTHVVIENIPASDRSPEEREQDPWTREEVWFELDYETKTATRCDKPARCARLVNFTLG